MRGTVVKSSCHRIDDGIEEDIEIKSEDYWGHPLDKCGCEDESKEDDMILKDGWELGDESYVGYEWV